MLLVSVMYLYYIDCSNNKSECMGQINRDYNEKMQPSFYFTAPESPYEGVDGIHEDNKDLIISKDLVGGEMIIGLSEGTGSMFPAIPRKSILLLVPVIEDELFVGDIVSVDIQGDMNMIHRIVKINEDGYRTKGDNNNYVDPKTWKFEDFDYKLVGVIW